MVVFFFVAVSLTAEKGPRRAAEQRAVNLLAQFLQRHLAQTEKLAVQNGKGVKEGEGDDFYPEQRQHRHRMVMGAMGQMPVLGQLAKGVVLYLPAQMPQVPNGGAVIAVQISRHQPNPVLLFLLRLPL